MNANDKGAPRNQTTAFTPWTVMHRMTRMERRGDETSQVIDREHDVNDDRHRQTEVGANHHRPPHPTC